MSEINNLKRSNLIIAIMTRTFLFEARYYYSTGETTQKHLIIVFRLSDGNQVAFPPEC